MFFDSFVVRVQWSLVPIAAFCERAASFFVASRLFCVEDSEIKPHFSKSAAAFLHAYNKAAAAFDKGGFIAPLFFIFYNTRYNQNNFRTK